MVRNDVENKASYRDTIFMWKEGDNMTKVINPYGFIYITTNMANGKRYIGQRKFYGDWQSYLGSGIVLTRAIEKYGEENFYRNIIAIAQSRDELNTLEVNFIKDYNAIESDDYYNIADGGQGGNMLKYLSKNKLKERSLKISKANKGRVFSKQHKQKISDSRKGIYCGINSPGWKGGDVVFYCDHCGKKHSTNRYQYNRSKNNYCSVDCKNKDRSLKYSNENAPNATKVICLETEKTFNSQKEAETFYNLPRRSIHEYLVGRKNKNGIRIKGTEIRLNFFKYEDYIGQQEVDINVS